MKYNLTNTNIENTDIQEDIMSSEYVESLLNNDALDTYEAGFLTGYEPQS